jgi:archaellum biogenesis ATPase FlaH
LRFNVVIGTQTMTNSDFLAEVYGPFEIGTHGWVCSFRADPSDAPPSVWSGRGYKGLPNQASLIDRAESDNNYFCTAVLRATEDGEIVRRKDAFVRLAVLVLDDVQISDVANLSYAIQTSPGKHQIGILLDPDDADCSNRSLVDKVMRALAARGRSNDASGNACVRYVRLPIGSNTKPRAAGTWQVKLEHWNPNVRWSLEDACAAVGIDLDAVRAVETAPLSSTSYRAGVHAGEMITGLTGPIEQRVYHDNITRLAASLISGGMFAGAAVEFLYSLMDQVKPDVRQEEELRRWESRRAEIPRAVKSAEKFAPENRMPPQITVNLNLADEKPEPQDGDLVPLDWSALAQEEPKPTAWRLEGWLPEGTVTLLSANGGVGKSNLSLQLGVALTQGKPFMNLQTAGSKVLVLSGEDEARTVHFRVANICADQGLQLHELRNSLVVYDLTQTDCVLWRDGHATDRMQWLADTAVRTNAQVIVIDNASDVFADNENDRTAVRGFMRALNLIAHVTGAAVLLLAHVDKASVRSGAGIDSMTTFSGSTAWNNSARSRWAMYRDEQTIVLRHEKCNLGPLQDQIELEFDSISKTFKPFGTIPGSAFASKMMRNAQRDAIIKLIEKANKAEINLSMNVSARNNVFRQLSDDPDFPPRMERRVFFGLLRELKDTGLVREEPYRLANRTTGQRVVLTDAGRAHMEQA